METPTSCGSSSPTWTAKGSSGWDRKAWSPEVRQPTFPQASVTFSSRVSDELAADVRRTVQTAAVLGREFDRRVLGHMEGDDGRTRAGIDTAVDSRLLALITELRYRFRQALLRDAAYDMQLHADRRGLHLLAAVSIEAVHDDVESQVEALAFHYDRGDAPDRAAHWYVVAGDRAADRFASTEAFAPLRTCAGAHRLLGRAVDRREDSYEILHRCHAIHHRLGDREQQERVIVEMAGSGGDDGLRAVEIERLRGELMAQVGDHQAARARRRAGTGDARGPRRRSRERSSGRQCPRRAASHGICDRPRPR